MLKFKVDRAYIQSLNWKPFDKYDWMGWSGCETPVPMIAESEFGAYQLTHIIDGAYFTIYAYKDDEPIMDGQPIIEINDLTNFPNEFTFDEWTGQSVLA